MKKRILSLCLALALTLAMAMAVPAAADLLEKSDAFYVADYADVLSAGLEEDIYWTNYEELYEYCDGAEIVVVTVNNTGGMNTEDYCYKVFNEWGIGGEKNNGVLILLSVFDKKYFTMVGKNLMDDLDSDVLYKLQSGDFESAFDRGDYESAVETLFQGCLDVLRTKFAGNYESGSGYEETGDGGFLATFLGGLLIMFLVILIFVVIINAINSASVASHPGPDGRRANYSSSPLFWWSLGRSSARRHTPPPPPPRPRGTTGYSNSRGTGGVGMGGSFGAAGRRTGSTSTRSAFSGSFRGSSGGRGFGGGRMGGGGGRSFGGGSGRR